MIRALIFDFDGLLIDTETPALLTWQKVYQDYGQELTLETWQHALGRRGGEGFKPLEHLATLVGNIFDAANVREKRWQHKVDLCELEPIRPGILETIATAQCLGLTCVVASSSGREWVEGWLKRHDMLQHFAFTKTGDDVENVKPAPDLFLSVAEKLCLQASECLVFEDSPNGTLAALNAGMPCVVVTNPVTEGLEFPQHILKLKRIDEMGLEDILNFIKNNYVTSALS
jgi:beta-phosphoglucomutase-like phosphatase (HAD superfamily)